ncbi:MAG: hypothetical protein NTV32_01815 [Gammaproteobacteria bacterium]|nr:hypothetical protein [Gammaproteobacteria bacterium]
MKNKNILFILSCLFCGSAFAVGAPVTGTFDLTAQVLDTTGIACGTSTCSNAAVPFGSLPPSILASTGATAPALNATIYTDSSQDQVSFDLTTASGKFQMPSSDGGTDTLPTGTGLYTISYTDCAGNKYPASGNAGILEGVVQTLPNIGSSTVTGTTPCDVTTSGSTHHGSFVFVIPALAANQIPTADLYEQTVTVSVCSGGSVNC